MVVVPDPALEQGWMTGRLDAPHEPGTGQGLQAVVDRLRRQRPQLGARPVGDLGGGQVAAPE
jgi:hypothetical protein